MLIREQPPRPRDPMSNAELLLSVRPIPTAYPKSEPEKRWEEIVALLFTYLADPFAEKMEKEGAKVSKRKLVPLRGPYSKLPKAGREFAYFAELAKESPY